MTKQDILKAIENGESVWAYDDLLHRVIPYKANEIAITGINTNMPAYELKDLFATKQQAEHYLHHANITRTEQLPFLTWEEFKVGKELFFTNKSGYPMCLCVVDTRLSKKIGLGGANGYFDLQQIWDLTEENFYKAYDECVRLFKGE